MKTIAISKFDRDITRIFDHDKEIFFAQLSSVAIEIVKTILLLAKTDRLSKKRDVVSIVVERTNYRIFHVEIDSDFVERYHFLRRIEQILEMLKKYESCKSEKTTLSDEFLISTL